MAETTEKLTLQIYMNRKLTSLLVPERHLEFFLPWQLQ